MNITIAAVTAPAHMNGVSRHAINLSRALLHMPGIDRIHFLIGSWQTELLEETARHIDPRLHVHTLSVRNSSLGRMTWYYRDLPHIAAQLQSHLVHVTYPAPLNRSRFYCPVVVSLHDLYPFEIPANSGLLKSWVERRLMRLSLASADAIACVSESTRIALKKWIPAQSARAHTVNNALCPLARTASQRPETLPAGIPFVLCVAQHRANKNIPLAVRIFQHCVHRRILPQSARLLIVGIEGPETRAINKHIAELGMEGRVLLVRGLHDSELLWCYQNCVALLAPARIEGFGLPVVEALQAGCPVVCSDIPAFREAGGDACTYIPWGSGLVDGYADALRRALNFPRPHPVNFPHLAPESIADSYMSMCERFSFHQNAGFAMLTQPKLDRQSVDSVRPASSGR